MIEGINSSLATAQATRIAAEVSVSVPQETASAERFNQAPFADPYISSYIKLDANAAVFAVLQLRDSNSGEVIRQFPTENQLKAFARTQEVQESFVQSSQQRAVVAAEAATQASQTVANTSPAPQPAQTSTPVAPENNVGQAQQSGQVPQTTISDPTGLSETV